MRGYKFRIPEQVAHIGNLSLMMTTKEIKYKKFDSSTGVPRDDGIAGFKTEPKKKIEGILVEWWEGNDYKKDIFHTGVLVPWDIAQKGPAESHGWLEKVKTDYSSSLSDIDNSEQKEE